MNDWKAAALAERYLADVPERLRTLATTKLPISLLDPGAGFAAIKNSVETIYSSSAQTVAIFQDDAASLPPLILNDLRFVEIALELMDAACQQTDEATTSVMMMCVHRIALEQALPFSPTIFHTGGALDFIGSVGGDAVQQRHGNYDIRRLRADEALPNLHTMSLFALVHEYTHFCLNHDAQFCQTWRNVLGDKLGGVDKFEPITG